MIAMMMVTTMMMRTQQLAQGSMVKGLRKLNIREVDQSIRTISIITTTSH